MGTPRPRICAREGCGVEFEPYRKNHVWCSEGCKNIHYNLKKKRKSEKLRSALDSIARALEEAKAEMGRK